jgi:hypothetical protein
MASPQGEDDGEDDYMNMTFGEEAGPKAAETSLQRRQRLRREGEERGRVKSKAELAAEAEARREEALSQSLLSAPGAKKSKGLAMMAKMGFRAGEALGSKDSAAETAPASREPIRLEMKEDRSGIGLDSERKRKVNEAAAAQQKKIKVDETEFRDRVRREREEARAERQIYAAMKVCERMDEEKRHPERSHEAEAEEDGEGEGQRREKPSGLSTRPLKSIPVVWRGLVRRREEAERDRRMRYDLEQSSTTRLPSYVDDLEDIDDKKAMGKVDTAYVPVEDLEEDDSELEEFEALDVGERLRRLVVYLRDEFNYCFWCKCEYPDETMDGCPGVTEEDHD